MTTANPPFCLLVYGNQSPMVEKAWAKYRQQVLGAPQTENPFAYQRFDAEEMLKQGALGAHEALNALQEAAETQPFLCDAHLVQIDRIQHVKMGTGSKTSARSTHKNASSTQINPSKRLLEMLQIWLAKPPPGLYLLLSAKAQRESDISRPLLSACKKHGRVERFITYNDWNAAPWVMEQVQRQGFSLTKKQVEWLIESVGNDLGRLGQELNKIKLLAQEGPITQEALRALVASSKASNIFKISQYLADKNLAACLAEIDAFFSQNAPHAHPQLLGILAHQLRNWLLVHDLRRQAVPESQWAGTLKTPPFLIKRIKGQALSFSMLELERALRLVGRLDVLVKMHLSHAHALLFEFVSALCYGNLRHAEHPWLLRHSPVLLPLSI